MGWIFGIYTALFIIILLYTFVLYRLQKAWESLSTPKTPHPLLHTITVSVIVPVRNEAHQVAKLLDSLAQQTHPKFEVIVIDDHSTDSTRQVVESHPLPCKKVALPNHLQGKKQAITHGIVQANGNFILTTDADCTVDKQWISSMLNVYLSTQAALVSGPVRMIYNHQLFQKAQALEFAALIGVGGASIALGKPSMCNGANLGFSRNTFFEVNGYEGSLHIPSGDDMFLLEKMKQRFGPASIHFAKTTEAIVSTPAIASFGAFYQQRKRWASKWKAYQSKMQSFIAIMIFALYALWLTSAFLIWHFPEMTLHFFVLSFIKFWVEYRFMDSILRFLRIPFSIFHILGLYLIYPLYAIFFGITAQFGSYRWKKRSVGVFRQKL